MADHGSITGAHTRAPKPSVLEFDPAKVTQAARDAQIIISEALAIISGATALIEISQPIDDAHSGRRIAMVDDLLGMLPTHIDRAIDILGDIETAAVNATPASLERVQA